MEAPMSHKVSSASEARIHGHFSTQEAERARKRHGQNRGRNARQSGALARAGPMKVQCVSSKLKEWEHED
jgi:hypothetical protein